MKPFITVADFASAEYSEKRSRFIGEVFACTDEETATRLLSEARTKYWDAKHHVYAYVLRDGSMRFSDDSEPHGTAGKPVLDAVLGSGMVDVMVIVTRYFGGTLLGTGGLVHAYSTAATDALKAVKRVEMCPCVIYETVCPYAQHEKLMRLIGEMDGRQLSVDFGTEVCVQYSLRDGESCELFLKKFTDLFAGRLIAHEKERTFFAFPL